MRIAVVTSLVVFGALGCADRPPAQSPQGTTTTTRADEPRTAVSVAEIRAALVQKRPSATMDINALDIKSENGVVTLRGAIADEQTHAEIVDRLRTMGGLREIRDELTIRKPVPEENATPPEAPAAPPAQAGAAMDPFNTGGVPAAGGTLAPAAPAPATAPAQAQAQPQANAPLPMPKAQPVPKVVAIREEMLRSRPKDRPVIDQLMIWEDESGIVVRGEVPDDYTHQVLITVARSTAGGKHVKDEMKVFRKR